MSITSTISTKIVDHCERIRKKSLSNGNALLLLQQSVPPLYLLIFNQITKNKNLDDLLKEFKLSEQNIKFIVIEIWKILEKLVKSQYRNDIVMLMWSCIRFDVVKETLGDSNVKKIDNRGFVTCFLMMLDNVLE